MKLKIENGKKAYNTKNGKLVIFENINVEFESGKFYAIIGESGKGKTTLLNILGLLDELSSGKYYIDNKESSKFKEHEKDRYRAEKIGFVFQSYYLNPKLKIYENLYIPLLLNKKIKRKQRYKLVKESLKKVGIENKIKEYPKKMSGGEQQRAAIARSLINNPEVILADEPTGNLDEKNEKNILDILKKLSKEGKCVIVVSHSKEIKKYADIIFKIEDKEIKVIGD
jgi:putative ABC transport system ATP-binding protein